MKCLFFLLCTFCSCIIASSQTQDTIRLSEPKTAGSHIPDSIIHLPVQHPANEQNRDTFNTATLEDTLKKQPDWTIRGLGKLNFSQTAFFNWSAGGDNSVSTNLHANVRAYYKNGNWARDNKFIADFGLIYTTANK